MGVIALHTLYIASLFYPFMNLQEQMILILAAYAIYLINATQFILKLRAARRQEALMKEEMGQEDQKTITPSSTGAFV
jgi:3-vinyl bacteriochlorophyllide hydratase